VELTAHRQLIARQPSSAPRLSTPPKEISLDQIIAGSPPISLSLIVERSKCDAEASVIRRTFFIFRLT